MRVKINTSIGFDPAYSRAGAVVEVDDKVGQEWIKRGLAKETSEKVTPLLDDGTPNVPPESADTTNVADRSIGDLKGDAAQIAKEKTGEAAHTNEPTTTTSKAGR